MDIKLITAIFASITALFLSFINFKLSRINDKQTRKREIRTDSYVDFINCVAELAQVGRNNDDRSQEILHKLAHAKTRIAIYGDKNVIHKLAEFDRDYGAIDSEAAMESFVSIILEMRVDSIGTRKEDVSDSVKQIVFGNSHNKAAPADAPKGARG